ncbi:MAG: hypothetical protein C0596_11195 [Marinilabiliales bacterium]|nr:MAG: hypothetical protein C0596_11195 [Marinilabiliales bacterium]
MNRLGINHNEIPELCTLINNHRNIEIKSIFSHLVGSDNENLDYFTNNQISIFETAVNEIKDKTGLNPLKHILNSAGISRFTNYQYDMVRLGIGLYGLMP